MAPAQGRQGTTLQKTLPGKPIVSDRQEQQPTSDLDHRIPDYKISFMGSVAPVPLLSKSVAPACARCFKSWAQKDATLRSETGCDSSDEMCMGRRQMASDDSSARSRHKV